MSNPGAFACISLTIERHCDNGYLDAWFELRIPYREDNELIMDILRHGAAVEVIAPDALRLSVREQLQCAIAQYK